MQQAKSPIYNTGAELNRQPQVASGIARLREQQAELESTISELENRLMCALRVSDKISNPEQLKQPETVLVPLAQSIREITRATESSIERLRQIIAHIELP